MSTKKLARELGIIRKRSQKNGSNQSKGPGIKQFFPYLIIIDFESTCWREKNNYGQEIIEFPAVLLNTSNGTVESEFHTYVQPQEHPVLSEFCTELTGITQTQVEAGVPLAICLSRFTRWLHSLQQEKGVVFLREGKAPIIPGHPCAFVTWSDWDLGVCLLYECKRKQICKPEVLNSWIDLRATYKLFYSRKPKGLNGALQDLGIEFSGREHSGLDDSRNTARLAWRLITDGCFMKITKSLDRAPVKSKPMFPCNPSNNNTTDPSELSGANTSDESRKEHSENYQLPSTAKSLQTHPTMPAHPSRHVGIDQNPSTSATVCQYQSLVTPKTVLDGLSSRLSVGGTSAPVRKWQGGTILFTGSTPSPEATGLVLVSTTVSTYTDTLPRQLNFDLEASKVDWTDGVVLLSETEESGSYDDVLLEEEEGREGQNKGRGGGLGVPTNSGEGLGRTVSLLAPTSALVLPAPSAALASLGRSKQTSIISTALAVDKNQPLATSEDACFKMPRPVSAPSRENHRPVLRPFINKTTTPDAPHCSISKSSTRSCAATNYKSSNTSTPSQFTSKLSPKTANSIGSTTDHSVYYETPSSSASNRSLCNTATIKNSGSKGSVLPSPLHPNNMPWGAKTTTPSRPFTIYQDINSQSSTSTSTQRSTRVTLSVPPSVLSSHVNQSRPTVCRTEEPKKVSVTSPLCGCGRRAKRLTVGNGGPNHGRGFYCCPVRRSGPGISANGPPKKGCEFFKWESALLASVTPGPSRNTFFSRPSGTLVRTLR